MQDACKGWHSRGFLPHFDATGISQAITYHLGDSLPRRLLDALRFELQTTSHEKKDVCSRKRIEAYLDAGYGSCLLRDPVMARIIVENWMHYDGIRYRLLAWVVMPSHVHVLIHTDTSASLGRIVQGWKGYTGREISRTLRQRRLSEQFATDARAEGEAEQTLGDPSKGSEATLIHSHSKVWHREYWDRYIRDERHFLNTVEYIHQNPVKAGLARFAEDWEWSSAYRQR